MVKLSLNFASQPLWFLNSDLNPECVIYVFVGLLLGARNICETHWQNIGKIQNPLSSPADRVCRERESAEKPSTESSELLNFTLFDFIAPQKQPDCQICFDFCPQKLCKSNFKI